jgi:outer membrane autotransporter protein
MCCYKRRVDKASSHWRSLNGVSVTHSAEFSGDFELSLPRATHVQISPFHPIEFPMIAKLVLKRVLLISFLLCLWLVPRGLQAQTSLYWDNTFSFPPSGPWDTTSLVWSPIPGGVAPGSQTNWVQGDSAVFSASGLPGSEQSFNVALTQNLTVANLTYTGGNGGSQLFIAAGGNTINMANTQMVVAVDPGTTLFLEPVIADPIVDLAGTLILQSGNLVLLGANTYSGGTVITGTVTVGNDAGLGAAAGGITLFNGELLTAIGFSSARAINLGGMGESINTLAAFTGTTATYTGVISGNGNLTVGDGTHTGTVVLTGNNIYTGGSTTILAGTLQIGNGGTSGSIVGNVLDLGNLTFDRSDLIPFLFAGIVSGSGTLNQIGSGTLTLTGTNTYTGGTFISGGGTISVATDANLGGTGVGIGGITLTGGELLTTQNGFSSARAITLNEGTNTLAAANATTGTYTGVLSGNGGLVVGDDANAGTIVFTGNNTYLGGTTISFGTLQLGNLGTTGSIVGAVVNDSIFNIVNANTAGITTITNNIGAITNFFNANTASTANITNLGEGEENFGQTDFHNTSTAANATITNNGGETEFFNTSNAANATIANNNGGVTQFFNTTNAANAHITNFGEGEGNGGETDFNNTSNAANAIITNNAGGVTQFFNTSNAANAHITNFGEGEGNGGETDFHNLSTAANAIITNNAGGVTQFFDTSNAANAHITNSGEGEGEDGLTEFRSTSTAANATINNFGGNTAFNDTSTADHATITNTAGQTDFNNTSTAANATINNNSGATFFGGASTAANSSITTNEEGLTEFQGTSTAANATITSSGETFFVQNSTAGNATIVTNTNGLTLFAGTSTGGQARLITNAGGTVDISPLSSGGMTAGSIEGAGTYFLGSNALTVGLNNFNTEVSGTIVDGGVGGGTGGALIKVGSGTLTLSGANTYTGGTTITTGTLQIGDGGGTGSILGNVVNNAALVVNRSGTLELDGAISGTGNLSQVGSGTLVLTGTSTYTGATAVSAGTLQVDGVLGNTAVTVQNAATLAGKGTIGGSVTILDGGHLAPGPGPQTLSVGTLSLNPASILDYQLGRPGAVGSGFNTLVNVAGNLTLDGVLNVTETEGGQFGSGAYRLLNYKGALTDLTLNLGTLPTGFSTLNTTVNTAVPGQVNLVVNAPNAPTQFWDGPNTVNDGTIHGGTGTWVNFTTTNFTNAAGEVNQAWQNGVAIFTAAPGTVTVGADILFQGIEFSSDGYTLVGSGAFALHPTGTAMITTDTDVTATIAAPIVGAGGLNKAGPGLLTLSGQNTYSGGTTISDGALSVASDTNLGAANAGLELNGGELETSADFATPRTIALVANLEGANILAAADDTTATYSGLISGAGGLLVGDGVNAGTVVLTNFNNSYSGGTSILPGTLVAAGNDALGTGPVQVFNGTLMIPVDVTLPNAVTFVTGGVFNNAGTLNNNVLGGSTGTQTVINSGIVNGNVTLGGATDIVQLFTGSKITGNLGLNGTNSTLILDGAGQQLLSLAVVGSLTNNGLLVKQGSGTWTIDRSLDAPLGTDILAGILAVDTVLNTPLVNITSGATLQLNAGGSVGNLVDNGSLIFAGTGTVNFSTVISGPGNVIQDGPGTTILSGRNTYSGGTIIDLGALLVNNSQALGTGNVTVNGGVLGADPQPINVLGNYTQNAGGTLQLNIAGRAPGQFDVLNVNGNAFLNGTLRLVNLGYQPQLGDSLRLINTGGVVTGRFAQFQNPFALTDGFNSVDLVYARQSVTLEFLELNTPAVVTTTDFSSFAFTPNQRAAASLLDAVQLDPRAGNLISFLNKEPFSNLPGDFNKISPADLSAFYEISFSNANIQRLNLESRMDDLHNGSNGFSSNMKVNGATVNLEDRVDADGKSSKAVVEPILQPGPGNRWGVWMTGFGDFVSVDGDANANGYNFTTGGVSLGIDYRLTDELVVGVMAEYSHTWTSLKPNGSNDVNSGRGGVYATWSHHGFYLNGSIYGGYNSYNSSRSALQGLASGNTEGAELSTFISGGYDFHFGLLTVGPVAALQYTYANVDGFSENGSLAPMQVQSDSVNSLRSDVGFRLFYPWQVGKIIIEPSLKAAWEHEYLYSALPVTAGFANIPGPTATFTGPAEGHDSAIVSAGVSVIWTPTLTTYLNYDGQLGRGNYSSNAVTGGVRISF